MMSVDSISTIAKRKDDSKKLKRVISTKLLTEDYKKFRVLTSLAYQYGAIKEDILSTFIPKFISTSMVYKIAKIYTLYAKNTKFNDNARLIMQYK
jgi:hypothetical protein